MSLPVDPSVRRARSAISLGAAVAIFGAVLLGYDAPESHAAGGFLEMLFGLGRGTERSYDGYGAYRARMSHAPRRFRLAHHARRHDFQARRHVTERRKTGERRLIVAAASQKPAPGPAVIEIIAPARSPFVQVIGTADSAMARTPSTETKSLPYDCGKSCVAASATRLAPRVASVSAPDLYADPTLRPGDTVVTAEGMRILRPGSRFPFKATDFVSLDQAGKAHLANRSALHEIERAMRTPPGRAPGNL